MRPHSRWQFGLWTLEAVARVKMKNQATWFLSPCISFEYTVHLLPSLWKSSPGEGFIDIRRGRIITIWVMRIIFLPLQRVSCFSSKGKGTFTSLSLTLKDFTKRSEEEGKAGFLYHWKITLFPELWSKKISIVPAIQRKLEKSLHMPKMNTRLSLSWEHDQCLLNLENIWTDRKHLASFLHDE